MAKKTSSQRAATIAGKVLAGDAYTDKEVKLLAASVLAQTEPAKAAAALTKPVKPKAKREPRRFHYGG